MIFNHLFFSTSHPKSFSQTSSSLLFCFQRQISTKIIIPPHVVTKMFESSSSDSLDIVPSHQQIKNHQKILKELYKENPEFRKIANNLFRDFNNPNVKSIAFYFPQQPNLNPESNIFWRPVLVATALFYGIGIKPYLNNEASPMHALVNKENIAPILGHQDSMFQDPSHKDPSLIKLLALVNGFSESNAITWFKESVDILNELKEKSLLSYQILREVSVVARPTDSEGVGQRVPFKIIGENDELNFVSSFIYTPNPIDLNKYGVSIERMNIAILDLKKIVNSKSNRHEFILNNNGVQFLLLKNIFGLHGRGPVEESQKNLRQIIGIPLDYPHPSPSIQVESSIDRVGVESKDKSLII